MRTRIRLLIALAAVAALAWTSTGRADPPDILRQYTFVPNHSMLTVTGGFMGGFWPLMIEGSTFGIVTGWEPVSPITPAYRRFARFVDVDADLINLSMSPQPQLHFELDATLKLTGLEGTVAPGLLNFAGVEDQGWPMKVTVVPRGPLIVLTGRNQQPCCDFYHYELRAVARGPLRADFNGDGAVNQIDLSTLNDNFGRTGYDFLNPAADYSDPDLAAIGYAAMNGDANVDNVIDGADFLVLQSEIGAVGPGPLLGVAAAATIPEPAAWTLATAVAFAINVIRRTHGRQA